MIEILQYTATMLWLFKWPVLGFSFLASIFLTWVGDAIILAFGKDEYGER